MDTHTHDRGLRDPPPFVVYLWVLFAKICTTVARDHSLSLSYALFLYLSPSHSHGVCVSEEPRFSITHWQHTACLLRLPACLPVFAFMLVLGPRLGRAPPVRSRLPTSHTHARTHRGHRTRGQPVGPGWDM